VDTALLLDLTRSILAQPTAPFHEDAVRAEILIQLAQIPSVHVEQDDFGNVLARYDGCSGHAEYAFAAHMDHPAYVGEEFLGGVPEAYREKKPPTRDFGAFAMWDLPACEVRDGRIYSRACDDLIGCVAILALFQELECSSERSPGAGKMGDGPIIRVGDRTSIFDDGATAALVKAATDAKLPHQRCLMSGGTCEATAYQLYGYRTGGLCVALGNYHNCGPDLTIAPEFVAVDDVAGMIALMHAAVVNESPADPHTALREKLEKGMERYRRYY
jgi:endoglucanase